MMDKNRKALIIGCHHAFLRSWAWDNPRWYHSQITNQGYLQYILSDCVGILHQRHWIFYSWDQSKYQGWIWAFYFWRTTSSQSKYEIIPPRGVKSNEDLITTAQVCDLLEQQKFFYKDLLQQQNSYKGFVHMLMDSFNKRLYGLLKEPQIKSSTHSEGITVWQLVNELNNDWKKNQSRRNNLIFKGVPETDREKWSDSEEKNRKLVTEKLKLDHKHLELKRAHRSGKPPADKPRTIMVKFLRYKNRLDVLEKVKQLRVTCKY